MMKLLFIFSFLLLFVTILFAEEPGYSILFSKKGTLRLKAYEDRSTCSFSGTQTLSGTYRFGFSEICDNKEENGCVELEFYPDNIAVLPHFKNKEKNKRISISNYKEGAQMLMGKVLSQKVMASGKEAIKRMVPGHDLDKTIAVNGRSTLVVEEFIMGICCDSSWAVAKILKVKQMSKPRVITEK